MNLKIDSVVLRNKCALLHQGIQMGRIYGTMTAMVENMRGEHA